MSTNAPSSRARRRFLKLAVAGGAVLAAAGTGYLLSPATTRAAGYQVLREADLPLLRALIPVILVGAMPSEQLRSNTQLVLNSLDQSLAHVSPAALALLQQLFEVTAHPATRGPLTGVWQNWEQASGEQVSAFLQRWRDSPIALLRQGYAALLQAVFLAWYDNPASWQHCGYPGPPAPFNGAV